MRVSLALAVLTLVACGRETPVPTDAPNVETLDLSRARDLDASASSTPPDAPPDPTSDAAPPQAGREPLIVTELPELCRRACDNALALTLGELPADTSADMRRELERAVSRDCPGRCLQRASAESARCIAEARTTLALAACP